MGVAEAVRVADRLAAELPEAAALLLRAAEAEAGAEAAALLLRAAEGVAWREAAL